MPENLTPEQRQKLLARAAEYVNTMPDDGYLDSALGEAIALVNRLTGQVDVPATIRDRAYLEAVSELYHRRQAPSGISQFVTGDGAPIRVARDPLVGVYPILRPYVGLGVA